uniref:G protein-coupled receptor 160 n=1 Tax=Sinocyclocheilus anshuiensis TaxID=1608454 RepID=A0A671SBE7_9TELE
MICRLYTQKIICIFAYFPFISTDWSFDCCDFHLGLCRTMETSIPSLLLVLWLKSLLNWLVVVVQRHYMIRSFSRFFCISLALIDSLLSFVLTAIFYLEDFNISGWHLTRYYICLLAQITCFIYAVLHLPVFLLVGLDNFCKLSSSSTHTSWKQKLTTVLECVFLHFAQQSCVVCLRRAMCTFLSTWASFLVLMIVSPLLPLRIEMHAHLQLNVIWLCFLNSFSVALALCGRSFTSSSKNSDTITDGFCSWYFCFTCGADEWNYGQQSMLFCLYINKPNP